MFGLLNIGQLFVLAFEFLMVKYVMFCICHVIFMVKHLIVKSKKIDMLYIVYYVVGDVSRIRFVFLLSLIHRALALHSSKV